MKTSKYFYSYEGEGKNIGLKTLFFEYERGEGELEITDEMVKKAPAFYVNVKSEIGNDLITFFNKYDSVIKTIEVDLSMFRPWFLSVHNIFILMRCSQQVFIPQYWNKKTYALKMVANSEEELVERIELANRMNKYQKAPVYIFPMFKENVGEIMMKYFDKVGSGIRIMPPAQLFINI
jgi:hypothetical protein